MADKDVRALTVQTAEYPVSVKEWTVGGKRYTVTRVFVGEEKLNDVVAELAVRRCDREFLSNE